MSPERRRLAPALLLSLLIHAWLLSLTFGGQGLWFPGFGFPWQERRIADLAASGLTNKEIGKRMHLSPRTVSSHLYRIFPNTPFVDP